MRRFTAHCEAIPLHRAWCIVALQNKTVERPNQRGEMPMLRSRIARRTLLAKSAVATTALVAAPYVRGAHAAGSLSIGFWDHWVPGANKASETLCKEWGEKNKVEISIDYITSQGNKNVLTIAAEAQAQSGHDIFAFPSWQPHDHANRLEPVDEIMAELIKT